MTRFLRAALLLPLASFAVAAVPPEARFDPARLSASVKTLASDAFEGRAPATPAEAKTVAFIVDAFRKAGLQPGGTLAGGKRGWTQDVPLLRANIAGAPSLVLDVAGKPVPLTQGDQIAVRAALTGQKQVSIAGAPLVFVGYGVHAPERDWDDFKGVDLHGKIMVVLVNDPDFEGGEGAFGGKAMTYYGRWTYKYEEAARRGAAGVLVVHENAPASYGWATVKNSNTGPVFDIERTDPKASHTPLEGWIQRDLMAAIATASGTDLAMLKQAAQRRNFTPVPLKATLTADYAVTAERIISKNVIGRLPGKGHEGETVLYSGHWDHLGFGAADARGDRIFNGAVDNATGIASLIELARAFAAAPRTERSIVFLAVTAEERGLLGSEYYAANPVYPLGTTAGAINLDALGVSGPARDFSISGTAKLELLDRLVAAGAATGRRFTPDPHPEAGNFYRSDHFSLAKRGVPALSYESGSDLVTGGVERGEQVRDDYIEHRYHQPADEWAPALDFTGIAGDLDLVYQVGRGLANSRDWPNWAQDAEFRAARDVSAAERR